MTRSIQTLRRHLPALLLAALLPLAVGCVYRMPIQQGNYLQAADLDQLQNGMTRAQVRFLLGTPMIPSGFDSGRWDYYYFLKARRLKKPEQRKVTVYFENDKVARVVREGEMDKAPESAPIRG